MNIVIRTRDRAQLLARALDDVLEQTFSEWRVVVVNDGGAAAPVDALIAERSRRFAGRIDVVHVEGGSGSMEAASNQGAQRGAGEFVVIHDDDDTWAPEFLATMVNALESNKEAVAAAARTEIVFERLEPGRIVEISRAPFVPPNEVVTMYDLLQTNRVVPISLLIRRSVYSEIGWYDPNLRAVGDWEFNLRLIRKGQILFVGDEPLAFWHQRPHARGTASNSVFGGSLEHLQFDRIVRDKAIQEYVDRNGVGGLLYLSKYIEETARYYSLQETVKRAFTRLVPRLPRLRRR